MEQVDLFALGLLHKLKSLGEHTEKVIAAILPDSCDPAPVFSGGAHTVYRLLGKGDERQTAGQIAALCKNNFPDVLVFLATVSIRTIAAMVAAELKTGLSADCTDISLRLDNVLVQTRPTFGGLLFADIVCAQQRPQIANEGSEICLPGKKCVSLDAKIVDVQASEHEAFTKLLEVVNTGRQPLSAARTVLSGGRGIESADGMQLLQKLAALTGAALGASRAAVNAGYAQYGSQVGLTGQTIRPDVYVAFGISGAVQHLVGMEGAETVIAVNTDKNAPIFEYADVGIVADWKPIVKSLIENIEKRIPPNGLF